MPIIRVYNGGKFKVGKNFTIISKSNTGWYSKSKIIVTDSGNLTIGDNSGMNSTLIFCSNSITIGNNVKIGGGTRIYDTNFHSTNAAYRANPILDGKNAITAPIVIGDNVFIGTNCIISKGITIGSNSIIAAGSVVVKSIPDSITAAGSLTSIKNPIGTFLYSSLIINGKGKFKYIKKDYINYFRYALNTHYSIKKIITNAPIKASFIGLIPGCILYVLDKCNPRLISILKKKL